MGPLDERGRPIYGDLGHRPAGDGVICESCEERDAIRQYDLGHREVAFCGPCILEDPDNVED